MNRTNLGSERDAAKLTSMLKDRDRERVRREAMELDASAMFEPEDAIKAARRWQRLGEVDNVERSVREAMSWAGERTLWTFSTWRRDWATTLR